MKRRYPIVAATLAAFVCLVVGVLPMLPINPIPLGESLRRQLASPQTCQKNAKRLQRMEFVDLVCS
jgi:hypothetical protein